MKDKYLFLIIFPLLIFISQSFSLAQTDSALTDVHNYWQIMNRYSSRYHHEKNFSSKFSNLEIDTLTTNYYKAINSDPIGFQKKMEFEFDKFNTKAKAIHGKPDDFLPGVKVKMMKDVIASKYGNNFAEIISVPYYLLVKIIADSGSVFEGKINQNLPDNPRNSIRASQANIQGIIEDVLKGGKRFKVGQKITISYLTFWILNGKNFEKGKSYLLPLRPWGENSGFSKLTLNFFPDFNYAIYPVDSESILTPNNYFGVGDTSNWGAFRKYFINKYILK